MEPVMIYFSVYDIEEDRYIGLNNGTVEYFEEPKVFEVEEVEFGSFVESMKKYGRFAYELA